MFVKTIMRIQKEDYDKLLNYSKEDVRDFVENIANKSPFPPCGYGFIFPAFFEEDGKYFVSWQRYDSCD